MKYEIAEFWANTIKKLLVGHQVFIIDVRQSQNWKPESEIVTLNDAKAFAYDHAPGEGHFHILSSYGVHDGFESVKIDRNAREIVMYSHCGSAAGGQACWRVLHDLDPQSDANWKNWIDASEEEGRQLLTPFTTLESPVIKTPTIPEAGETPLHIAVRNDNTETVRLLLATKVEVNVKDLFGWTPLHWASVRDNDVNVRRLISAGANVNIKDNSGWMPIDLTTNEECRRLLEDCKQKGEP